MKRSVRLLCLALCALLLLFGAGMAWLVGTEAGARFALTRLPGLGGYQVTARGVQGRLWDQLRLSGVRLAKPQFSAEIDRLDLDWRPGELFRARLSVRLLSLSGVRIQDDRPPSGQPTQLGWPRVSRLGRGCTARVASLRLSAFSYRHLQEPPVELNALAGCLTYRDGNLTLSGLSAVSRAGRVSGELLAGFGRPAFRADLALVPATPLEGVNLFSLVARLSEGKGAEFLAGRIALAGRGGARRLELSGELGLTPSSFLLRSLKLVRPGERGTLTGGGSLTLTRGAPLLTLSLEGSDIDLRDQMQKPTRLFGTLNFSGTSENYRGDFTLRNRGPGWQAGSLSARYRGGASGLKLSQVAGTLLDGRLGGDLELSWSAGVRLAGHLTGRGLNPGKVAPDWSGRVNLDLAAVFKRSNEGVLSGRVNGKLLESRLHARELTGEIAASYARNSLRIDRLLLHGRGFALSGAGELDRRLDLTARVDDLSRLVPGGAGVVQADAWVRWRGGRLAGSVSGRGERLAVHGVRVAELRLSARLGEGVGYPLQLEASLNRLAAGSLLVETALVRLKGSAARHTLEAQLGSSRAQVRLALAGGYRGGSWQGELTRLSGRDLVGPWGLAAPARVQVSSGRLYLSPLVLSGAPAELVEAAVDLTLHPLSGSLKGDWSQLNLARANSWLTGAELSGASSGEFGLRLTPGGRLLMTGRAEAQGTASANGRSIRVERLTATLDGGERGLRGALDLALAGNAGEAQLLFDSREPTTFSLPRQGDLTLRVSDLDLVALRPLLSANLQLEGHLAGGITGKLLPGRRLDLKGDAALDKGTVAWSSGGEAFEAAFQKAELALSWRGGPGESGQLNLAGELEATGGVSGHGERLALERLALRLAADQSALRAAVELSLQGGGTLRGNLSLAPPAGLALPETGEFALTWGGIDPMLLKPWLPGSLNLKGSLAGATHGRLLPGRRLELEGGAEFSSGSANWRGTGGELNANLRSASLGFAWRGESLTGTLTLALAEYGSVRGRLALPFPARLPIAAAPSGVLQGSLSGRVQEKGFLTSVFPGLVQESHGDLDLDLRLGGTWSDPDLGGSLKLGKAGAYLPSAGIHLSDLELTARLTKELIRIEGFRAVSGPGHIEGSALVQLKGWQVASYSGTVSGERFQTVYLPELQLLTSPGLGFAGEGERLTIRGELRVPEMLISGPPTRSVVAPSSDVILEGAPKGGDKKFPLQVQGELRLILGDKVRVKAEGIDATLGGEMDLTLHGLDNIRSRGEIRVIKGRYQAYGIDLEIVRGRLYYVGEGVDHPTLDILALRTVNDVKAGVTVAGPLGSQVVKLYSEPTLPEVDIMAYMVLGHPLGTGSTDQASLLVGAASSLFSFGQSESLQDQIKDRLGLNLGVETVDQTTAGRMGYREVPVTPTGAAPKISAGESLLTVGKYLTPKLYLSYGRSLVTGGSLIQLRYDILRHWQVETQSGSESGADIFYKLEFN